MTKAMDWCIITQFKIVISIDKYKKRNQLMTQDIDKTYLNFHLYSNDSFYCKYQECLGRDCKSKFVYLFDLYNYITF